MSSLLKYKKAKKTKVVWSRGGTVIESLVGGHLDKLHSLQQPKWAHTMGVILKTYILDSVKSSQGFYRVCVTDKSAHISKKKNTVDI